MESNAAELWEQLISSKKLERDRGLVALQRMLESMDPEDFAGLASFVVNQSKNSDGEKAMPEEIGNFRTFWEQQHAVLSAYAVR